MQKTPLILNSSGGNPKFFLFRYEKFYYASESAIESRIEDPIYLQKMYWIEDQTTTHQIVRQYDEDHYMWQVYVDMYVEFGDLKEAMLYKLTWH